MCRFPSQDRNAERNPVRMPASCRSATGLRDEGWLEDVSEVGCCLVTRGIRFSVGNHVVLRSGGLSGITGIVRWTAANRCGIEFSSPLYGAVLDHLCRQFGNGASTVGLEMATGTSDNQPPRMLRL